ncbi:MAG: NAD-dependent malic enzyme [Woeseiaceae bacterium]|nr:NAD-dependent malic enzyme [Woeseiaceae bacterium]
MEKFELTKTPHGDELRIDKRGPDLLRYPLCNKGTAFTHEERRELGIEALLPAQHNDIDTQAERIFRSIFYNRDNVGRNIGLAMLQDRNEVLFYKLLQTRLREIMPIVYTPTVGEASRYYSRVFRRGRGLFITPDYAGRIEDVIRNAAPFADVRLMVVTDNEAILGIGDQGAGGMAISVGKLALYTAGAGIHPARTLPISLDVGTNNEDLLNDPLYLGYREKRLRGDEYVALVDEFVEAARSVFPNVVIQWEDFRKDNALMILDRYRDAVPSFNDDIQGTGAVAMAALQGAGRISGREFTDNRIVVYGAGAAGLGIARQIRQQLSAEGLQGDKLRQALLVMDSGGIISSDRDGLDDYKQELAWTPELVAELKLGDAARRRLADVIAAHGSNAIIGASGQGGSFDEDVVTALAANCEAPVVMPMSNPTSISEGVPEDILRWSGGRALVATGSPFDAVEFEGQTHRIGQANNVFVFPGIGLGAIASNAREITDNMINASALALAASLDDDDIDQRSLMPDVSRLWAICGEVAVAVAQQAIEDGVADQTSNDAITAAIESLRWQPEYPRIVSTADESA